MKEGALSRFDDEGRHRSGSLGAASAAKLLAGNAWWPSAIDNTRRLLTVHGSAAARRAEEFGQFYAGRRAAMVFDVVASKQRKYLSRVVGMVTDFEATGPTLLTLAQDGPGDELGLRRGEAHTMRLVADGLLRFMSDNDLSEEDGVHAWASRAAPLEHAIRLDPYVGVVKGMGPALFAYLRCGVARTR